jgi:hypothetical protein
MQWAVIGVDGQFRGDWSITVAASAGGESRMTSDRDGWTVVRTPTIPKE